MYKQTETVLKSVTLGFGTGSIYDYGCYLVSLANGLLQKGYSYNLEQLNDILKNKGLFLTTAPKNYIDVANIAFKWNDIFTGFKSVIPWGSTPSLDEILKPDTIAIGEVDAQGIGGSPKGQHFVLITKKAGTHAVIFDPWRGVEEDIAVHWGNLGYIKSLRLFIVKVHVEAPIPQPLPVVITDQTKIPQIVDSNGNVMEVQAIRSKLNDQASTINALNSKILSAKNILG